MSKTFKYSELLKKLNKKIHLPVKDIENIILDTDISYNLNEEKYANNLNNIIISKKLLEEKYTDIRINYTRAKNIYVENLTNLGGITIPYDIIKNNIDIFITFNKKLNNIIPKINILNIKNIKNREVKLEKDLTSISIKKDNEELMIGIEYSKKRIDYKIDELGNLKETKHSYVINEEDIINNTLNITKLTDFNHLTFPNIKIDTLIINKHYIENITKLTKLNHNRIIPFHPILKFNNLRIIDDNDMKLVPFDKTFNNANNFNTKFVLGLNKYIYINDSENNILIYLDKNNHIKVLDKKELLKMSDVLDVKMNYDTKSSFIHGYSNLVLIKYKEYYKIIDFDKEYILKDDFFYLLSRISNKYFQNINLIKALKNKDFITIYNSIDFTYSLFYKMYEDYMNYKNYLENLKRLGFTNNAIKYLFDKKFNNIINPNDNIINDLTDKEIDHFNDMANEYIKIKRLSHEKE